MPRKWIYRKRSRRWLMWPILAIIVAAAVIYIQNAYEPSINLVDAGQEPVSAGAVGWDYQQSLLADLDNDGATETIYIMAKVAADPEIPGQYQWDDGQPWQVFVQDGSELTRVYARYVQIGKITAFITDESVPRLIIAEQQGAGYALYEVKYNSPGHIRTTELVAFSVKDLR